MKRTARERKPLVRLCCEELKTPPMSKEARMNAMDKKARARLEAAGFDVFDDACDALGLTDAEKAIVDARQAAKAELERLRAEGKISQAELARRMGTKQPAVSRLFKSPGRASLETLLRALAALGSDTPRKVAAAMM